jgi:hypothetical protein
MWEDLEVALEKVTPENLKAKPSEDDLGFGVHFTDHMFLMTWSTEDGWHDANGTDGEGCMLYSWRQGFLDLVVGHVAPR